MGLCLALGCLVLQGVWYDFTPVSVLLLLSGLVPASGESVWPFVNENSNPISPCEQCHILISIHIEFPASVGGLDLHVYFITGSSHLVRRVWVFSQVHR